MSETEGRGSEREGEREERGEILELHNSYIMYKKQDV